MVTAVCDRVIVVQEPMFRVTSGQTITLEAKGTDTSIRINFLVSNNNYAMMYYFLRFFKMRTAHRVVGPLNVSAYTFDDATRAFASVRVGVQSIAPIREVDFQGNISGFGQEHGCFPVNEENAPPNREYSKLKFIIFRYVWENWSNETLIKRRETLRKPFTDYLEGFFFLSFLTTYAIAFIHLLFLALVYTGDRSSLTWCCS